MSAKHPGRPEFEKMIKLIEQNPGTLLFLSGNLTGLPETLWMREKSNGSFKKSYRQNYYAGKNLLPEDNALISAVEFGMANQYIRDLSTNIKRGNKTKLEKGELPGPAPIGIPWIILLPRIKDIDPSKDSVD